MAKRKNFAKNEPDPDVVEKAPLVIMKPYIDRITKDTQARDINIGKLPDTITIRFKKNGAGETTNRYVGKSGIRYDFNGGVPLVIKNGTDIAHLILKAKKNPEVWEIIGGK